MWNSVAVIILIFGLGQAFIENGLKGSPASLKQLGDPGKWVVGKCLMADFNMKFQLHINSTSLPIQEKYEVPMTATVKPLDPKNDCGNTTNILELHWTEKAQNDTTVDLARKITGTFEKSKNASTPVYGMTKFVAVFEVAKYAANKSDPKNLTTNTVEMIFQAGKGQLVFQTPLDRSYACDDIEQTLNTTIRFAGRLGEGLNATDMSASHVAFDAFRPHDAPHVLRTPSDCRYQPNDIIPIAVGVALAGLVIAVLIAYVVGRNRQRQRGYQSV